MGNYLNSVIPWKTCQEICNAPYYVDKSMILEELAKNIETTEKYICITRPRRFGKTVMANMIAAYFSASGKKETLFRPLRIGKSETYARFCGKYVGFLSNLLKDKAYVALAYMTGILPVAKYSSGSELNMFMEYTMATKEKYSDYFGFSDEEVDMLYERYQKIQPNPKITRKELELWYDGYQTPKKIRIYNPRSVVCALSDNQLNSYWTSSGSYDEEQMIWDRSGKLKRYRIGRKM